MEVYKAPTDLVVDGILMPGNMTTKERFEQIKSMETTDKDIILAAYPRCGSTWVSEILYLLQSKGDFEGARSRHISETRSFIDLTIVENAGNNKEDGFTIAAKRLGKNRILKTHAHASQLRKPIEDDKAQILVVIRNPKDCIISYYEFYKKNRVLAPNFTGNFDDFLQLNQMKQIYFGDWLEFYSSYWQLRHRQKIHFILYEKAKEDLKAIIREIASVLEINIDESFLARIAEHTSFETMKDNNAVDVPGMKGTFIRQGMVGSWRDTMTKQQSEEIDKLYQSRISELGLPVIYEL